MDYHWHSLGKEKAKVHHSLSPDTPDLAEDLQETDSDSDNYGGDKWNPYASTKLPPLDGEASDKQWELDPGGEVEDVESEAFNDWMVKMILNL